MFHPGEGKPSLLNTFTMFHKASKFNEAYYDTMSEMPNTAMVAFPKEDGRTPEEMTVEQMLRLSEEGYYTIEHTVTLGCCDHWRSIPLSAWVANHFEKIIRFVDDDNNVIGYDREEWYVTLTRNANYHMSEVWDS